MPAFAPLSENMTAVSEAFDSISTAKFPNAFLDEKVVTLRPKIIPWEGYLNAQLITAEELKVLSDYEGLRKNPESLTDSKGVELGTVILSVLPKVNNLEVVQYLLTMMDDLLPLRISWFFKDKKPSTLAFHVLSKLILNSDDFISYKSASIFTLCSSAQQGFPVQESAVLLEWSIRGLNSSNVLHLELTSQLLLSLLRNDNFRQSFGSNLNAMSHLAKAIKSSHNKTPQVQYQLISSVWLLSFLPQIAKELHDVYGLLIPLIELAKAAVKEKVIRVCVAVFRNMLQLARKENMLAMIGAKLHVFIETLSSRKLSDEEILADVEYLKEELTKIYQSLSTFEEYLSEIRSGKLCWSPPHQSELFWKQNIHRFNDKDYEVLRMLTKIITTSQDALVLAVAAHDVGQYVKFHNQGKKIIQELGTKEAIMQLITNEVSDVRYHALTAIQKFMINVW